MCRFHLKKLRMKTKDFKRIYKQVTEIYTTFREMPENFNLLIRYQKPCAIIIGLPLLRYNTNYTAIELKDNITIEPFYRFPYFYYQIQNRIHKKK